MKKNKLILSVSMFMLVVLLASVISAVGVGSLYTKDNPLEVYVDEAGTSKEVLISLQNAEIPEGVTFNVEIISEGTTIDASFPQDSYSVAQNVPVEAMVTVDLPRRLNVGDRFKVIYKANSGGSGDEGQITMGSSFTKSFDVLVVEKPVNTEPETTQPVVEEKGNGLMWTIIIILLVLIVIVVIWLVRRKKAASVM